MHATVQVHLREDSTVGATVVDGPTPTPCLTFTGPGGDAEVELFFHDEASIERFAAALDGLRHEQPFHLAYRHGCVACERQVQRIANKLALVEALERAEAAS